MSKFEEWLEEWFDPDDGGTHGATAKAAWNAATKNAIQVLREANENGTDPAYWAEAIEQEQCE